ncbi:MULTISPECIES: LysR family transcriptional regulator [unclassified Sphingomonas]|uniref:LysR family transcriptional regulator n=1 Tax=unclassified Sphingomonas TaxID=196159 RepID=UPI000E769FF8|nr:MULTISPECIES: LysR family transcriptional regulator [unclassified Sphingomonas]RKE53561.1 DNA-binding transcriptional LysR family regulator [Sphingomonas sp. PP-CC-1A-547]TCM10055.1 DNA-binding transcriptional LysR family regulator [Sphingomonas sp. PP-CC-3G-468]
MIERYVLRYFLAVVDQGNFTRAAAQCRISQPTLSVGIAKLEASLGQTLFLRTNRRIELTPSGTRFAVHARRIEAEFAAAERDLQDTAPTKLVRLGIATTLPPSWIAAALSRARRTSTTERLEVVEGRSSELVALLDRGRIDVMLGAIGDDARGRVLFEEGFAVAVANDHRLAGRATLAVADVAEETMIVRRHCEALAETSRFFTARGVRPFMAARTVSDDRALTYVRAGLGMTVMPLSFASEGIAMIRLTGFDPTRRVGVLVANDSASRIEGSAAVAAIEETFRDLHAAGADADDLI